MSAPPIFKLFPILTFPLTDKSFPRYSRRFIETSPRNTAPPDKSNVAVGALEPNPIATIPEAYKFPPTFNRLFIETSPFNTL